MYQSEITRGQVIRSKAQWAEHGERSSKFCIGLEKYNQELKHIKVLKTNPDTDTTDPKLILNHLYEYYSNMYDIKHVNVDDFTNFEPVNTLNEKSKADLERPITIQECKESLDGLPCNKTPGTDGLSAEFYRHFWPIINRHLYKSILCSIDLGELTIEQKRGIITLIPKSVC